MVSNLCIMIFDSFLFAGLFKSFEEWESKNLLRSSLHWMFWMLIWTLYSFEKWVLSMVWRFVLWGLCSLIGLFHVSSSRWKALLFTHWMAQQFHQNNSGNPGRFGLYGVVQDSQWKDTSVSGNNSGVTSYKTPNQCGNKVCV